MLKYSKSSYIRPQLVNLLLPIKQKIIATGYLSVAAPKGAAGEQKISI